MSEAHAVIPSHIELVVLGCLSQSASPSDDQISEAVRELWLRDESPEGARAAAADALDELRHRGLVDDRRQLTETGARTLREACGLSRKPAWSTFRQRYFPAIALGVPPAPPKKGKGADATVQGVARRLGVEDTSTMNALCDALIGGVLGMARGPLTLARIRAHVLALRVHAAAKAASDKVPGSDAPPVAPPRPPVVTPPGEVLTGHDVSKPPAEPPVPRGRTEAQTPDLLACVRETLTEIGDDGRFGEEKVFVSALWHQLAHRGSPADLSLDHFKQWLVTANRNRWLTLARADVVGAMDPKKVRESEIQDRGATFHFVLDPARNPAAQQGRSHVR